MQPAAEPTLIDSLSPRPAARERPRPLQGVQELVGKGPRENPFIIAEFRRWRNRPLPYIAIAFMLVSLIVLSHQYATGAFALRQPGRFAAFLMGLGGLLLRPSAIVPAVMVWRALYSYRDGPMYEPFRTTFLRPGHFAWGILAVPCFLSLLTVLLYTGIQILPNIISSYAAMGAVPLYEPIIGKAIALRIGSILFEGFANGFLLATVTLYLGIRTRARLEGVFLAVAACLAVQLAHALYQTYLADWLLRHATRMFPHQWQWAVGQCVTLYALGTAKFIATWFFWRWAMRRIGAVPDSADT